MLTRSNTMNSVPPAGRSTSRMASRHGDRGSASQGSTSARTSPRRRQQKHHGDNVGWEEVDDRNLFLICLLFSM